LPPPPTPPPTPPSSNHPSPDIHGGAGPISALFINDKSPKPTPHASGALIKIKAFGLNRMDLLQREGHYPLPPQAPKTLGVEFSGVIESFGSAPEHGFSIGDEVFGLAYGGAYAEYIVVSTHMLVHKPKELSWEEAAGIPETWITATQAMYLVGEWKPGMSILWHAGASSVSIAGIQLALGDSASAVYVTVSSQEKIDFCVKEMGATAGFNYNTQKWDEEVLKATGGKGVDLIVDFVGQNYFEQNLNAAARDAHIVHLGALSGTKTKGPVDLAPFLRKRLRFEGSSLRSRDEAYQGRLRDQLVEHALPRLVDGRFKVLIEKVFPWGEIQKAHELLASNTTKGKVICTID
jgi:putative PIG3 family NAD(P)H quinone oxidoreductase